MPLPNKLASRPIRTAPSGKKDIFLYTKGGEYSLDGKEYIGEYHLKNGITPMTGPQPDPSAQRLRKLYTNEDQYTYDSLKRFATVPLTRREPVPKLWTPDEEDYLTGFALRYFVEKVQDDESYAIEIDTDQYNLINTQGGIDGGIYLVSVLQWRLTGPEKVIYDHNQMEVYKAEAVTPSIAYAITSYTQGARITGI